MPGVTTHGKQDTVTSKIKRHPVRMSRESSLFFFFSNDPVMPVICVYFNSWQEVEERAWDVEQHHQFFLL